jgi:steroid Delta-isomerase
MTKGKTVSNPSEIAEALLGAAVGLDPARMHAAFSAYLASWRDGDVEARANLFAPNAIVEDPVGGAPLIGIAAIREFWAAAGAHGFLFQPKLELFVPGGSEAVARFVMEMRKPPEPVYALTIHEVVAFAPDYRITSLRAFYAPDSFAPPADK